MEHQSNSGDVSEDNDITQNQMPGVDLGQGMQDPNAQFQQQNMTQPPSPTSAPQIASKWSKNSYKTILATDGDLYERGINDRLEGHEMDEALSNLSDDYLSGYEQGAFYNGSTGEESAPPFEHREMGEGSDQISRNPVASRHDGWYERNNLLSLKEHLVYEHGYKGTLAMKSLVSVHEHEHYISPLAYGLVAHVHTSSEPFTLDEHNDVLQDDKNNQEIDPTYYDDQTRDDDLGLEKDKDRGMDSTMPPSFDDSARGLTNVGSVVVASKDTLNNNTWFKGSSASLWERLEVLQSCIDDLSRVASSDSMDEQEYSKVASLLAETKEQYDTLYKVASNYTDFDQQEYLESLPGGTVASNYGSLDRDGDLGPDDGSFLYREASRVRDEVQAIDGADYAKVSAQMYVADAEPSLLKDHEAFREASLYFVYNDTLPILDTVKRAKIIDDFMNHAETSRRTALKQGQAKQSSMQKAASAHMDNWSESLEDIFGESRSNWI